MALDTVTIPIYIRLFDRQTIEQCAFWARWRRGGELGFR